ncbi:MAG: hypothetical protein Satyrvirus6_1, partial [Satyrvirus sp.]
MATNEVSNIMNIEFNQRLTSCEDIYNDMEIERRVDEHLTKDTYMRHRPTFVRWKCSSEKREMIIKILSLAHDHIIHSFGKILVDGICA